MNGWITASLEALAFAGFMGLFGLACWALDALARRVKRFVKGVLR